MQSRKGDVTMAASRIRTAAAAALLRSARPHRSAPARADLPPLIPRAVLFGNPEKAATGNFARRDSMLAYLAPSNGVLSIWVRTVGKSDDRVVATDPVRPIRNVVWQPDSKHVLYEQERAATKISTSIRRTSRRSSTRDLTPFGDKVRSDIEAVDPRFPNEMLVTSNKRDPNVFDVYRVDLKRGVATLDTQNPGSGRRMGRGQPARRPRGAAEQLRRIERDSRASECVGAAGTRCCKAAPDDQIAPVAFSADNRSLYVSSSVGANSSRLLRYDLAQRPVFRRRCRSDLRRRQLRSSTRRRASWSPSLSARPHRVGGTRSRPIRGDFDALAKLHAGDIGFLSSTANGRRLIVAYLVDNGPVVVLFVRPV